MDKTRYGGGYATEYFRDASSFIQMPQFNPSVCSHGKDWLRAVGVVDIGKRSHITAMDGFGFDFGTRPSKHPCEMCELFLHVLVLVLYNLRVAVFK